MFFGAALLCGYSLCAVTVGPNWCVVYPDSQKKVVNRALKVAAEEVAGDINEATGLKIKALPASKAKPPAIYIGAEFAEKAGLDLAGLEWYDNVIAEKEGNGVQSPHSRIPISQLKRRIQVTRGSSTLDV